MEKLPYFPLYVDTFLSSGKVELMPLDGIGSYILLLCRAWGETPAGSLPNDDRVLARWARASEERWQELKPLVMAAFSLGNDGRWHQPRMREEHSKARKLYEGRRKGALNAAKAKRCNGSSAIAQRLLSETQQSNSSSNSTEDRRSEELRRETDDHVRELYELYPRKKGKGAALKSIRKALKLAEFEVLKSAVLRYAKEREGKDPEFCAHPATWFNQRRWEDMPDLPVNEFKHDAAGEREILDSIDPEEYEAWKRENA